ncbi:FxSxx-COOH cyclophane-containing RiPP peptide [Frankia tisae]|uniref:FxSxx-COOH cyclophane-containing RiPP peptide n=1 Tax=Frankia tisae TaxID=2950104 RepID=UPI0021BE8615|nr:FxSxx-COOH cyclophane-containing RiPP peptide [Frankia tisae]
MIDGDNVFESVLPDLSRTGLAELGDHSNPHLLRALARLRQEAESPTASQSGFNSSVRSDDGR